MVQAFFTRSLQLSLPPTKTRRCLALVMINVVIACIGCGGNGASTSSSGPQPQSVAVAVSSASPNVLLGSTDQFVATVSGTSNTAVTWSVNGIPGGNSILGTISSSGLYTAPADLPQMTTINVTATSQVDTSKSASTSITIMSDISVTITTGAATVHSLAPGGALALTAAISSQGQPDQHVNWTVNGTAGGTASLGTIVTTGLNTATYTAPAAAPNPNVVTLGATSVADSGKSSKYSVGIFTFKVVASKTIGAAGGNLLATGTGSSVDGTQVVIPGGALSQDTLITISSVSPTLVVSAPFDNRGEFVDLGPTGLLFSISPSIALPSTSTSFTNRSDLEYTFVGDGFRPLSGEDETAENHGQVFDSISKRISSLTTHFSIYGVLGRPDIESAIDNSTAPLGTPIDIPIDVSQCIRCKNRSVPISQIIVHSTNDNAAPFESIIAWIHGTIGDKTPNANGQPKEAFFATYYIDKAGRIIQLVPDDIQTSHIANHNPGTIGIEVYDGNGPYTAAQIQALTLLVTQLMNAHGVNRDSIFRHKDFTQDPNHQDPYQMDDTGWVNFKAGLPRPTNTFTLTVFTAGTGNGSVSSTMPAGLNCDSSCSAASLSFPVGTSVTLAAAPDSESTFMSGWSGACSGNGSCTVAMTKDQFVTATFDSSTVTYSGMFSGTVVDHGNGGCPGSAFTSGPATLTLTESSTPFTFDGTLTLNQRAGICDDYSGTYSFSGTFDPTSSAPVTFSFGLGSATGTFNKNVFSGTWTFTAGPGPDVADGTFSLFKQ